jgi:hypothetical protein
LLLAALLASAGKLTGQGGKALPPIWGDSFNPGFIVGYISSTEEIWRRSHQRIVKPRIEILERFVGVL